MTFITQSILVGGMLLTRDRHFMPWGTFHTMSSGDHVLLGVPLIIHLATIIHSPIALKKLKSKANDNLIGKILDNSSINFQINQFSFNNYNAMY